MSFMKSKRKNVQTMTEDHMKSIFLKLYYAFFMILIIQSIKNLRKWGKEFLLRDSDGGGHMTRNRYVQKVMITYIEVDCYERNFKYGSDKIYYKELIIKW